MVIPQLIAEREECSDDALLALLDDPHKWELRTKDATFDTHYHTLREALDHAFSMNEKSLPIHAVSKLDGTIYVDEPQLLRLLQKLYIPKTTA